MSGRGSKGKKKSATEIPSVLLDAENELIEKNYEVRKVFRTDDNQIYAVCISPNKKLVLVHLDATKNIEKKDWETHVSKNIQMDAGDKSCLLKATEAGAAGIGIVCTEGYCTYVKNPDMEEPVGKRLHVKSRNTNSVGQIDNSGMYIPIISFSEIMDEEKTFEVEETIFRIYVSINGDEEKKEIKIFKTEKESRMELEENLKSVRKIFSDKTNEIATIDRNSTRRNSTAEDVESVFKRDGELRRAYDEYSVLLNRLKEVSKAFETLGESVSKI